MSGVARSSAVERIDPADFAGSTLRWLNASEKIEARAVADLFSQTSNPHPAAFELRCALQKFLLLRTLADACRDTRFYAAEPSYAAWRPAEDGAPPDLSELPLLDRVVVAARTEDFLSSAVRPRSICHTSGSTGTPLNVYKSFEEIAFINAFYTRLFEPVRRALPSLPLILS